MAYACFHMYPTLWCMRRVTTNIAAFERWSQRLSMRWWYSCWKRDTTPLASLARVDHERITNLGQYLDLGQLFSINFPFELRSCHDPHPHRWYILCRCKVCRELSIIHDGLSIYILRTLCICKIQTSSLFAYMYIRLTNMVVDRYIGGRKVYASVCGGRS